MSILYCDCFSGISGDMFLAAMLDAGLPGQTLSSELDKLRLPEFKGIKVSKVNKGALSATSLAFDLEEHDHAEEHHGHAHSRHLSEILALIASSGLSEQVKLTASKFFRSLGSAEAKVHGIYIEEVHFHEVGAADSILDLVGAAVALEYFNIGQVFSSPLPIGSGTVQTQHGTLPLPAPATLELLTMAGAKLTPSASSAEMVTPTGAAILAALAKFEQPEMQLTRTGMGAGKRDFAWPNVLRVMIGESTAEDEPFVEIETNIDDMNPQFYGPVMQHLFTAGALDVYFTPIQMKKNRPAVKLSVIARKSDEAVLSRIMMVETSTLGVRTTALGRHMGSREVRRMQTPYGEVAIKLKILEGKVIQAHPEYEDCARIAEDLHLPVAQIYAEVEALALSLIDRGVTAEA